jgi:hypothetical protein
MSSVPPPSYSTDPVSQVVASQLMQSISSAAASNSHPYYPTAATSYMPQGMMLPHLAAVSQSSAGSQSQSSTPSVIMSQQVSPSPTAQSYYQNAGVYQNSAAAAASSAAASYVHQTVADLAAKTEKTAAAASAYASYDYQPVRSPSETETNAAYSSYNENSALYADASNAASVENSSSTNYATSDNNKAVALANAATAAIDITKIKLPPKWKAARDSEGRLYYYHTKTRVSQWYPPKWEEPQQVELIEQSDVEETSDEESSVGEDDDEESNATRKRRHQSYGDYEALSTKRRILGNSDQTFDVSKVKR